MQHSVLIVEDNSIISHGLETLLNKSTTIKSIQVAKSAEDALSILETTPINIAIVDISLPGMNGFSLMETCKKTYPDIHFIVLTSHEDRDNLLKALSLGAHAYCTKNINSRIVQLVDDVAQGGMWVDPAVSPYLMDILMKNTSFSAQDKDFDHQFTDRERHILNLLAQGRNNQQIADTMHFSVHSVKVYLSKIFSKLGVDDRTQAAVKALQHNVISFTSSSSSNN